MLCKICNALIFTGTLCAHCLPPEPVLPEAPALPPDLARASAPYLSPASAFPPDPPTLPEPPPGVADLVGALEYITSELARTPVAEWGVLHFARLAAFCLAAIPLVAAPPASLAPVGADLSLWGLSDPSRDHVLTAVELATSVLVTPDELEARLVAVRSRLRSVRASQVLAEIVSALGEARHEQ